MTSLLWLWLCFCLSGAAALALEMLWMRSAGLVLGATAATAATILGCYFAGLGLGSIYARRKSAQPVFRYACFEAGAAAGALSSLGVSQRWHRIAVRSGFPPRHFQDVLR